MTSLLTYPLARARRQDMAYSDDVIIRYIGTYPYVFQIGCSLVLPSEF